MPELWLYAVSFVLTKELGVIGHSSRVIACPGRIDSPEAYVKMIDQLTHSIFPDGPPDLPEGFLPVVPLTFTLLTAKQGPGVPALTPEEDRY